MDSVTQLALGAAVGEATLGRRVGYRAAMWGGICGTLPDLDVFIPLNDAVMDFTYHRSFSHSLLVLIPMVPLIAWLIITIHPTTRELFKRWCLLVFLVFVTHVLLDSFTTYGTQIFWPLFDTPVALSSIFIIDPLYTLPLVVGVISALVMTRQSNRGHRINQIGLFISTLYLGWTLVAKQHVESVVAQSLANQHIEHNQIFTVPTPFNSLLWRAVVMDKDGYYEGYYSILDEDHRLHFTHHSSDESLLREIEQHWPVQRLKWFTRGLYSVGELNQAVVISDLRMGVAGSYSFRFKVADVLGREVVPTDSIRLPPVRNLDRLQSLLRRIWHDTDGS